MTHYHEAIERGADMSVAIDTLAVDVWERFCQRVEWRWIKRGEYSRGERARDVDAIRGYCRAIRILREVNR